MVQDTQVTCQLGRSRSLSSATRFLRVCVKQKPWDGQHRYTKLAKNHLRQLFATHAVAATMGSGSSTMTYHVATLSASHLCIHACDSKIRGKWSQPVALCHCFPASESNRQSPRGPHSCFSSSETARHLTASRAVRYRYTQSCRRSTRTAREVRQQPQL